MLVAGILSGTSVDAIDVALVEIAGEGLAIEIDIAGVFEAPFPDGVREEILAVSDATVETFRISQLNFLLGQLFGETVVAACEAAGISVGDIDLVGSHGQTIYHQADPAECCGRQVRSTLQIGEPSCIAQAVRAPVVADFRVADMAAGGQGAPLVPFVDYLLFRHPNRSRIALNIGGIANLTVMPAGAGPNLVVAFDSGPGNIVLDQLVAWHTKGERRFDTDGEIALGAQHDELLLAELLADPYYTQPPPKTTGRERYGERFVDRMRASGLAPEVLIATAAQLTVRSILLAIERFGSAIRSPDDVIVSGGGGRNPAIVGPLREGLPGVPLVPSDELGIASEAKEAVAFAVLAYEAYHGRPSNLPSATGAAGPVVLGKLVPPGKPAR